MDIEVLRTRPSAPPKAISVAPTRAYNPYQLASLRIPIGTVRGREPGYTFCPPVRPRTTSIGNEVMRDATRVVILNVRNFINLETDQGASRSKSCQEAIIEVA